MTKRSIFCSVSAMAAMAAMSLATPALAQGQGGSAAAGTGDGASAPRTIDELVVTAQRREQSLQDVPIVVTTVNEQQLQDAGIRDIKDLTIVAPGLTVTTTSNAAITSARIRGVGTVGDNVGLESSVGIVIDGVYRPRNGVAFSDLGELERIEILKGPQGTLFGKNTSAGVINIITKKPSFELSAASEATVTNYEGFGASLSLNGPIVDEVLAGRLYLAGRDRQGYYERVGPDTNDQSFYTGRGQLLWRPSETFDANLSIDYTKRQEQCCGSVQIINGATAAIVNALAPGGLSIPPNPDDYRDYGNRSDLKHIEDKGAALEANLELPWLGGARLTSVTAYRDWRQEGGSDIDWTGADILYAPRVDTPQVAYTQFRTFSQELRLAGETERLNWIVGGFFATEKLDLRVRTVTFGNQFEQYLSALLAGLGVPGGLPTLSGRPVGSGLYAPGAGQNDFYGQDGESTAVFGNVNYRITEQLELTVGLRYTWEDKELVTLWSNSDNAVGCRTIVNRLGAGGATAGAAAALVCPSAANPRFGDIGINRQSLEEDELTGTAKLSYRFNPEILAYASYARGYKAGGFNLDRIAPSTQPGPGRFPEPVLDTSFKPELVDSYELGLKTTLLDRTLLLNATVFYQIYEDFQLNAFNGLVFTVASVPEVISRGVDADFIWFAPVDGLTFNGGVTYAETYYPDDTPVSLGTRFRGSRLSLAPLWSVSGAASYEREVTEDLKAKFAINAKWVSSYNTGSDLNPVKNQEGFALVNARVALARQDDAWSLEAFAQNLFDKNYYQVAFDSPFQPGSFNAFLGAPRTYGVTLRFSY